MDKNYIAGFFDADGYVTLTKNAKNEERTAVVGFTNNELSILQEIEDVLLAKLGVKGKIVKKSARKPSHQDAYDLKYHGLAASISVLNYLPFVHPKKMKRLDILKLIKELTPRNGKYSPELLKCRRAICEEFLKTR